jgi:hypothetical protein
MARKMDQTEELQIPRVMAVAIGNGADHHYEIHDMHLNRVWLDKDAATLRRQAVPFKFNHAGNMVAFEDCASEDLRSPEYWMPRA